MYTIDITTKDLRTAQNIKKQDKTVRYKMELQK